MDRSTLATFGEQVNINGFCVIANVLEDALESAGFSLPVEGRSAVLVISNEDKERVQLAKGMRVEFRGREQTVSDFNITNTTLWRVDLE